MNFTFENAGINTYLVYALTDDVLDTMTLGMLTNNKINGLAPAIFTQMDANRYIKYNISAKVPVEQFFAGPVNKARLLGVFNGIVNAMLSAEDYMIDPESILLDTKYIFSDVSTCETILICLPVQGSQSAIDLGQFFKRIMFNTQFDQTENCDYVAKIINHLNSVPVFSLTDFKTVLDHMGSSIEKKESEPELSFKKTQITYDVKKSVASFSENSKKSAIATEGTVTSGQNTTIEQPIKIPQPSVVPSKTVVEPEVPAKKISMVDLLLHYNSENAAAYKAQQEAKKASGGGAAAGGGSKKKEKKAGKKKKQAAAVEAGFAIPGQKEQFGPLQAGVGNPPIQNTPNSASQGGIQMPPVIPITPAPVTPIPVASVASTLGLQQTESTSGEVHFGETQVLNAEAGLTTALNVSKNAQRQNNPQLVRLKNNEIVPVNKPGFRIGKEKSYVDYFIADNTAISRSHANILVRDGHYYVIDTNSTNHTFVDGKMIPSSTEVEIFHGTKLRFANEDFEFRLF